MARLSDLLASQGGLSAEDNAWRERQRMAMQQRYGQPQGAVSFAPDVIVASRPKTARDVAAQGARRSSIANAAAMVGAGSPSPEQQAAARAAAMAAAKRSGIADAAASVGAAPSRGQAIRDRLAELRAGGMGARDAVIQAAREGTLPEHVAAKMLAVPDSVAK